MALTVPRAWIIAYDIRDPRRLSRVHRCIKTYAIPVQYSVYWFQGSAFQLANLFAELRDILDINEDDVRAYQVPTSPDVVVLGRSTFPTGVHILPGRMEGDHGILRRYSD